MFKKKFQYNALKKHQDLLKTDGSQDMLLLEIQMGAALKPLIYVLNLYNALINSHHSRRTTELLMKNQLLMSNQVLIRRDLNLYHIDWDEQTFNATRQAKELFEQISKNVVFYKLSTCIVTHDQGVSIDLVIASTLLTNSIIEYYIELELDCTSNQQTIYTTIEYGKYDSVDKIKSVLSSPSKLYQSWELFVVRGLHWHSRN